MRCKPADGAARDPAAQLHRCNHFFHTQDKSTGAVAKQATKLAGDSAGSERSTVDVGSDNRHGLRLPRSDQRLGDGQGIEQTEAGAANIQRTTILAHEQSGMKLG